MLNPIYIIPARGGSKGIPGKNIKLLDGKPLIAYTIEAARQCMPDDSRIIVSTDSDIIADTTLALGLAVPYRRPAELAKDSSGSREVILDVMDWADRNNISYDCIVLLQPTSPLREAIDIKNAISLYESSLDMVVSVTEASSNPYYNCFETDRKTGFLHVSKGDGLLTRRQDAPLAWEYNGAIYVINPQSIRERNFGEFSRRLPYIMPKERSVDIDSPTDWIIAETIIKQTKRQDKPLFN